MPIQTLTQAGVKELQNLVICLVDGGQVTLRVLIWGGV